MLTIINTMLTKTEKEIIDYVFSYINETTNDWFTIKTQLIQNFSPKDRKKFGKRHYSTKKRMNNKFDFEVISYWEKKSKSALVINQELLHPKDWKPKPSGWALQAINEKRKQDSKRRKEKDRSKTIN
jgi:hypothetical protein